MSLTDNQARTFLHLLGELRPHLRRDAALPARLQRLLSARRDFGSRDRRLYRELTYTTLRYLPWIEPCLDADAAESLRRLAWLAAEMPATRPFRAAFATGTPPAGEKRELLPAWFFAHCPEIFAGGELEAQLRRAPLWLRLQTERPMRVLAELEARGWECRRSSVLPEAVELLSEADVTQTEAWAAGECEVQDLGSQMILASLGLSRGGRWLDACAGAGGKTLQLARLVGPTGEIDAHDIRPAALAELRTRATRAGLHVSPGPFPDSGAAPAGASIRIVQQPDAQYDGVLVDAPCSGSGTWRRAPHLKWTTTEAQIRDAAATQQRLLDQFSARVKHGGRLVYATCSLSPRENEEIVAAFLAAHPDFQPERPAETFGAVPRGAGWLILPARHDTDGFFFAPLRRDRA